MSLASVRPRAAGATAVRSALLTSLIESLARVERWAWQGPDDATAQWVGREDAADLDVWCATSGRDALRAAFDAWPAGVVADSRDPGRLQHLSVVAETRGGLAVVDVTFGDLRVGPVLLLPEVSVTCADGRLTGAAAAADLLVRPLLRGRVPGDARLEQARTAWAAASPEAREDAAALWSRELGHEVATAVVRCLEGQAPGDLATRARRVLLARTIAPRSWRSTWAARHSVLPAGRSAGPVGLRRRGVVVVLVGTDGSGKSTVATSLAERLERLGFDTVPAYFGMARGNLPGVGLARRLLGVAEVPADAAPAEPPQRVATDDVEPDATVDPRQSLSHPALRRVAAWYYMAEYVGRYAVTVWPHVRRRRVVICDRYVYDLRDSPWPGSAASRVAERLVPRPDVLVLPDAPAEVIHARKPERTLAEQAAQQERFRALVASRPARVREVVVDTSGRDDDGVADLVAAVVTAAHRPRRASR